MKRFILIALVSIATFGSSQLALAAESTVAPHMTWRMIDFAIFVGILYYFLKDPIVSYFRGRRQRIFKELEEAKKLREEAENLLKEIEKKTANLNERINEIREMFEKMALKEVQSILKGAKSIIEKLEASLEQEREILLNRAKMNILMKLKNKTIEKLKEKFKHLSPEEHESINFRFIELIGRKNNND